MKRTSTLVLVLRASAYQRVSGLTKGPKDITHLILPLLELGSDIVKGLQRDILYRRRGFLTFGLELFDVLVNSGGLLKVGQAPPLF